SAGTTTFATFMSWWRASRKVRKTTSPTCSAGTRTMFFAYSRISLGAMPSPSVSTSLPSGERNVPTSPLILSSTSVASKGVTGGGALGDRLDDARQRQIGARLEEGHEVEAREALLDGAEQRVERGDEPLAGGLEHAQAHGHRVDEQRLQLSGAGRRALRER